MQQPFDSYQPRPRVPLPSLTRYPVPPTSRMTALQWTDANDHWRGDRIHPHGIPENFAWGTVLWATDGRGPIGVVLAAPDEPVETAHRIASEITATRVRRPGSRSRTMPRIAAWGGVATTLPTLVVVARIDAVDSFSLPAAAVAGVATAYGLARRRRLRAPRSAWRHLFDPAGTRACLPHLRWLTDLTEQVPDQATLVWGGVREMVWTAPTLAAAAGPVEQVSIALARTARARRRRDLVALDGLPEPDPDPRVSRLDDIAAGVVGALGFEEEVYSRTSDELEVDELDRLTDPDERTEEPEEPQAPRGAPGQVRDPTGPQEAGEDRAETAPGPWPHRGARDRVGRPIDPATPEEPA